MTDYEFPPDDTPDFRDELEPEDGPPIEPALILKDARAGFPILEIYEVPEFDEPLLSLSLADAHNWYGNPEVQFLAVTFSARTAAQLRDCLNNWLDVLARGADETEGAS